MGTQMDRYVEKMRNDPAYKICELIEKSMKGRTMVSCFGCGKEVAKWGCIWYGNRKTGETTGPLCGNCAAKMKG